VRVFAKNPAAFVCTSLVAVNQFSASALTKPEQPGGDVKEPEKITEE
jgi:hypothetical protein